MTEERDFKGVWIRKELYLAEGLSWSEKILYVEIHSLDGKDGCFASNDYLADFLGTKISTVSNNIRKLKDLGLVEEVSFDGRRRVLTTHDENIINLKGRLLKNKSLNFKNQKHNNKDIVIKGNDCLFKNKHSTGSSEPEKKSSEKKMIRTSTAKRNVYVDYFASQAKKEGIKTAAKHERPDSKIYQKAAEEFTKLEKGMFSSGRVFDKKSIEMNNIDSSLLNSHKWTRKEIRQGLHNLLLYFTEGYWPSDKEKIQNSNLPTLLYNPRSCKSMFLNAFCNPPKLLGDTQTIKDPTPNLTSIFLDLMEGNGNGKLDRSDKITLIKNIRELTMKHKEMGYPPMASPGHLEQIRYRLGRPEDNHVKFCEFYSRWVQERFDGQLILPWMIGPEHWGWNEFRQYVYEELEVKV